MKKNGFVEIGKQVFCGVFFLGSLGEGAQADDFGLVSSSITYKISHLLKTSEGTSTQARGKISCRTQKKDCNFLVAVPVASFDSGNSNRDAHMKETMKEANFPLISVSGHLVDLKSSSAPEIEVESAGKTVQYHLEKFNVSADNLRITGEFIFKLDQHGISAPSLLTVAIKNEVPISFRLNFK